MTSMRRRASSRRSSKEMFALKAHVANICFKCFRCFRVTLQVFYIVVAKVDRDVAKVDQGVAHVAMAIHICFKCMFQMFYLYQTYVAGIFI